MAVCMSVINYAKVSIVNVTDDSSDEDVLHTTATAVPAAGSICHYRFYKCHYF